MSDSRPTHTSIPSATSTKEVPLHDSVTEKSDGDQRPIDLSDEEHNSGQPNTKKGTFHLRNHLKRCPFKGIKGDSSSRQGVLNFTKESSGRVKMNTYHFDQDKCRMSLAKAIIVHEYPLSMVDHVCFRGFLNDLQPLFKVPTRNTTKSDILKIYDCERVKLLVVLDANNSRIAITADMWTSSNQKKGFMAITAHYIGDSWTLQSRIVRFIYVPCPHTADVLSTILVASLFDWNLNVARDVLAIPVSTVASESAFSTSGRFVSPHQNRLHPSMLEALMCAQDWLRVDIHKKSSPSSYFGVCSRFNEEEIDDEDALLVLTFDSTKSRR